MSETQVEIASKLYAARRTLRRLTGPDYARFAARWMDLVRQYCEQEGVDVIHGVMELLKEMGDDVTAIWLMAAAVELIEPDEETP